MALVNKKAALLVKDKETNEKLIPTALQAINNQDLQDNLAKNITTLGKPDATDRILKEIEKLLEES